MYALCVSGAVNTQGFVWKFFYALYIHFHSFIHKRALKAILLKNSTLAISDYNFLFILPLKETTREF